MSLKIKIIIAIVAVAVLVAGFFLFFKKNTYEFVGAAELISGSDSIIPVYVPPQKLSNPPAIVKAVYVTGYSAGSNNYLAYLTNLFNTTEINAVVVDIKDSTGHVSYDSGVADVKKYNIYSGAIADIDELVRFFHDKNIYVIGRIAVFEDPMYAKARPELAIYNTADKTLWKDNNGLSWLDPASSEAWDYNISLAKDAFYHGFDEVNFDYVRFPSDGDIKIASFPVWDEKTPLVTIIKDFFQYVRANLKGEKISVDLFGQTTTNLDGMGIGQLIENAFENFDYISPMVYPSHYINGFMDFPNPALHPYEVVNYSMATALARQRVWAASIPAGILAGQAKFRPWLQDFNMGDDYTSDMVRAQIKASEDALGENYAGFMLWNSSNIYKQGALLKVRE